MGGSPGDEARPPLLCVAVPDDAGIARADLLAATRARIARREIEVGACQPERAATWRLTVQRAGTGRYQLGLKGPDIDAEREVETTGQSREEIVQLIALTAVEAVRPSMEALLAKMGFIPPPEPPPAIVACPEAPPCEATIKEVPIEVPVVPDPAYRVGLGIGPRLGLENGKPSAYLELGGAVGLGPGALGLHFGTHLHPSAAAGGLALSLFEAELGLDGELHFGRGSVGLGFITRLASVTPSGSPLVGDEAQFFWSGGLGITGGFRVWELGPFGVAVVARAWAWPQPNRFLVAGEALLQQSHFEAMVGLAVSYHAGEKRF